MNFHANENLAKDALEAIRQSHPCEYPDALRIADHYCGDHEQSKNYPSLYVSLCFLMASGFEQAQDMVQQTSGRTHAAAAQLLKSCINEGPLSAIKSEDYFYKKGLIRDGEIYYPVSSGLGYGSDFDLACRKINPSYLPILKLAIRCAHAGRGIGGEIPLDKKTLRYIPVQLMPPGHERDFRLTALSHKRIERHHNALLGMSRRFVLQALEPSQIIIGNNQLIDGVVDLSAGKKEPSIDPALTRIRGLKIKGIRPTKQGAVPPIGLASRLVEKI